MLPAKTQISLGIRHVRSKSSHFPEECLGLKLSIKQTAKTLIRLSERMLRLIWVFAGRTCSFISFVVLRLKYECYVFILTKQHVGMTKVCLFWFNVAFNNDSVISWRCLDATGSSMLTFIVLPHWSIMPQTLDMIPHPVTLSWHWVDHSTRMPVYIHVCSTILTTLVCRGPGLNPWPSVAGSGHSTDWATGAGTD